MAFLGSSSSLLPLLLPLAWRGCSPVVPRCMRAWEREKERNIWFSFATLSFFSSSFFSLGAPLTSWDYVVARMAGEVHGGSVEVLEGSMQGSELGLQEDWLPSWVKGIPPVIE